MTQRIDIFELEDADVKEFMERIREAEDLGEPVDLYISCYGGAVKNGFAVIDIIRNCKVPVTGYALGKVHSMAIPILLSCHKRVSFKNTNFLIHTVFSTFDNHTPLGVIESHVKDIKKAQKDIGKIITKNTKLKKKKLKKIFKGNGDYIFGAKKAKKLGFVESII